MFFDTAPCFVGIFLPSVMDVQGSLCTLSAQSWTQPLLQGEYSSFLSEYDTLKSLEP